MRPKAVCPARAGRGQQLPDRARAQIGDVNPGPLDYRSTRGAATSEFLVADL